MDERKTDAPQQRDRVWRVPVLGIFAGLIAGIVISAASFAVVPVGKVPVGDSEHFKQMLLTALAGAAPGLIVGAAGGVIGGLLLRAVKGDRR
jgi:hypothetical protein